MQNVIVHNHGIGDMLMFGPCLRHLHKMRLFTRLITQKNVLKSRVLANCPYPATVDALPPPYSKNATVITHKGFKKGEHKIDKNARELGIELEDRSLEVWTHSGNVEAAEVIVDRHKNFLYLHNTVSMHPYHSWPWSCYGWCLDNLSFSSVYQPGMCGVIDINTEFEIMRRAKHIVLCSSVFVHAAEAMGLNIDCINYGNPDPKVRPLDMSKVANIREEGKFIRRNYEWVE